MTISFSVNWPALSSCTLLLGSSSTTIKAARLHIKSYRLLFNFVFHSKEYISLRTNLKTSDGLDLNSKVTNRNRPFATNDHMVQNPPC